MVYVKFFPHLHESPCKLEVQGRQFALGESVQFLYTRTEMCVHACEQEVQLLHWHLDT